MIYFIQSGEYIKVGFTSNIKNRYKKYVTENPNPVKLIHTLNGGYDIERKIHKQLKEFKHRGEWFKYTPTCKEKIAFIIAENKLNAEPTKVASKKLKYKWQQTLIELKSAACGAGYLVLEKEVKLRICETVDIVASTFRNHLIKLEKLKRITRTGTLITFV